VSYLALGRVFGHRLISLGMAHIHKSLLWVMGGIKPSHSGVVYGIKMSTYLGGIFAILGYRKMRGKSTLQHKVWYKGTFTRAVTVRK
jgi:hypothetical protein